MYVGFGWSKFKDSYNHCVKMGENCFNVNRWCNKDLSVVLWWNLYCIPQIMCCKKSWQFYFVGEYFNWMPSFMVLVCAVSHFWFVHHNFSLWWHFLAHEGGHHPCRNRPIILVLRNVSYPILDLQILVLYTTCPHAKLVYPLCATEI